MNFYLPGVDAKVSLKELLPWLGLFMAGVAMLVVFKTWG